MTEQEKKAREAAQAAGNNPATGQPYRSHGGGGGTTPKEVEMEGPWYDRRPKGSAPPPSLKEGIESGEIKVGALHQSIIDSGKAKEQAAQIRNQTAQVAAQGSSNGSSPVFTQQQAGTAQIMADNAPKIAQIQAQADQGAAAAQKKVEAEQFAAKAEAEAKKARDLAAKTSGDPNARGAVENSSAAAADKLHSDARTQVAEAETSGAGARQNTEETLQKGVSEAQQAADNLSAFDQRERDNHAKAMQMAREAMTAAMGGKASNWLIGMGTALSAIGGFKFGTNERGNRIVGYEQPATTQAGLDLLKQQRQLGAESYNKVLENTLNKDQTAFNTRAEMVNKIYEARAKEAGLDQETFMPMVQGWMQAGVNSEAQAAGLAKMTAELDRYVAERTTDNNLRKNYEQWRNTTLKKAAVDYINGNITKMQFEEFMQKNPVLDQGAKTILEQILGIAGGVSRFFAEGGKVDLDLGETTVDAPTEEQQEAIEEGNPDNEDVPDSVPAVLAVGEFVIKNEDIKKIRNGMGEEVLRKIMKYYDGPEKHAKGGAVGGNKKKREMMQNVGTQSDYVPEAQDTRFGETTMGALGGAGSGAAVGSLFGPVGGAIGAGVGALAGGISSGITSGEKYKAAKEAEGQAKEGAEMNQLKQLQSMAGA